MKSIKLILLFGLATGLAGCGPLRKERDKAISRPEEADREERNSQSKIVFSKGNIGVAGIRVIKPDGTGFKQLTGEKRDHNPKWSPGGGFIAFLGMREAEH